MLGLADDNMNKKMIGQCPSGLVGHNLLRHKKRVRQHFNIWLIHEIP